MHELDTERAVHVEHEYANQLLAAHASECQPQALYSELSFTFAYLFDYELVDVVIEFDCMKSAHVAFSVHELQLWVGFTGLYRNGVRRLKETKFPQCSLEMMHAGDYFGSNLDVFEGVVGI